MIARARKLIGLGTALGRAAPVWEGIHAHARDVPVSGPAFSGESWVRPLAAEATSMLEDLRAGRPLPPAPLDVAALCGALAVMPGQRLRVLDFGGGLGTVALWARERVRRGISWEIVEKEEVCDEGARIHGKDGDVRFIADLDAASGAYDVVLARSSLQYARDWRETLRGLALKRAAVLALPKLSAGAIPTYATAQLNVPGTRIAYWFLDEREVIAELEAHGYALASRSPGVACPPMRNFPTTHRLDRTIDLLFTRGAA